MMQALVRLSKSTRKSTTIRMEDDLKEKLQIQAVKEKRNLSDLLADGGILYLQSVEQP